MYNSYCNTGHRRYTVGSYCITIDSTPWPWLSGAQQRRPPRRPRRARLPPPFSKVTLAGERPRLERFRRTQDRKTVPRVARMELPLNGRFSTDDDGTMMTTRNSRDQEAPSSSSSPQTLGSFLHASASMFHTHHVVTKNVFTDLSGWERLTCAQQLQQQRQHHVHCSKAP